VNLVHQISWRLASLEALQAFDGVLTRQGVPVQQRVTHGNALGIYFVDPDGNRNEVYGATERNVPQPFLKNIDMSLPTEELLHESDRWVVKSTPADQPTLSVEGGRDVTRGGH
jgi:catechol-2,3-dioxygenase